MDPIDAGLGECWNLYGRGRRKIDGGRIAHMLDANLHPEHYATGCIRRDDAGRVRDRPSAARNIKPNTEVAFSWLYDIASRRYEHGGTTPGYTAHVEFAPDEDRGIVVLYNRMDEAPGQRRFVDRIAENINELMSGQPAARIDLIPDEDSARAPLEETDNDL